MIPPAYLAAVVESMRALGRDFKACPLAVREQREIEAHHRVGYAAERCAALLSGELVALRPWLDVVDDGSDGEVCA